MKQWLARTYSKYYLLTLFTDGTEREWHSLWHDTIEYDETQKGARHLEKGGLCESISRQNRAEIGFPTIEVPEREEVSLLSGYC